VKFELQAAHFICICAVLHDDETATFNRAVAPFQFSRYCRKWFLCMICPALTQVQACREATKATQGDSVLERLRGITQPQQKLAIPGMEFEEKKKPAKKWVAERKEENVEFHGTMDGDLNTKEGWLVLPYSLIEM